MGITNLWGVLISLGRGILKAETKGVTVCIEWHSLRTLRRIKRYWRIKIAIYITL